ncbi:FtsX-like permease family protein [Streptomyces sp. SCSIO 30461]|uniref:ABC transporter permease n=1 Tax=Streptomyces sp. SCSIO 30461 TaxID=3118085 RepID=UPI0030D18DEE
MTGTARTSRTWLRDLLMGARFAVSGGREGWTRTLLTGVGVALGVALLLVTTSIPNAMAARDARADARGDQTAPTADAPGRDTLLIAEADTRFHNSEIYGRLLKPEGPDAPLPPGLGEFPGPGEMAVSPALETLLKSKAGALLRERLDQRVTAVIGNEGLVGPGELVYYAGDNTLKQVDGKVPRVTGFDNSVEPEPLDPVLTLLILLVFVALLMPVAVFIAAAVRFGGERRDRRLAALRLVGADSRMTHRIAAGEALAGSLIGLALGAGLFAAARRSAGSIDLYRLSVFPWDLTPAPWLAVLVVLAVPVAAVAVTLFTLRSVVIEPLGVVRTAKPPRRRIALRLAPPVVGLALLYPMVGQGNENGEFNQWQVIGGVVLLLFGITALLPWLVETAVARLAGSGSVAWQLAVRRLQTNSGAAARLVNGIGVSVAGAIALQMLFAGVESHYTRNTGADPNRAAIDVLVPSSTGAAARSDAIARQIGQTKGVAKATSILMTEAALTPKDPEQSAALTVGSCAALRELAKLPSCKDGDTFVIKGGLVPDDEALAWPGRKLYTGGIYGDNGSGPIAWTLPASTKTVMSRKDPSGVARSGILATLGAAPRGIATDEFATIYVQLDRSVPDAIEHARTAILKADPMLTPFHIKSSVTSDRFASIRTGLFVGAACVLLLIGASLLVSQLEQLRERKKLLSALIAFGTKRSTLSLSVLWQTAVPVMLGLFLSTTVGVTLGVVLLKMVSTPVVMDWATIGTMTGLGAGVVLLVTLLSMPPLLRMMRPEGLRTE